MPDGYYVIADYGEYILVGVSFAHIGQDAPDHVWYDSKYYRRGCIEICNDKNFCSVRRYDFGHWN